MKNFVYCFVFAVVFGVFHQATPSDAAIWTESCNSTTKQDIKFGRWSPRDRFLYSERISAIRFTVPVINVDRHIKTDGRISYINVEDYATDGVGGCLNITGGGLGQYYVDIHVQSARYHGFNFLVYIYGH